MSKIIFWETKTPTKFEGNKMGLNSGAIPKVRYCI